MQTTQDIKDFAEQILGETINDELFYNLINIAKDRREELRSWQFLKKLDDTQTASVNTNITLPTDFREEIKVIVGSGFQVYTGVKFEEQHLYRNSPGAYVVDYANLVYKLLGNTSPGGTIYFYYKRTTPTITDAVTPVWPARFWPLLAYEVVGYFQNGVDADDVFARMSVENKNAAYALEIAMNTWDTNLQVKSQGGRIGVADSEPELSLGNM